jgi:hypothetical protein
MRNDKDVLWSAFTAGYIVCAAVFAMSSYVAGCAGKQWDREEMDKAKAVVCPGLIEEFEKAEENGYEPTPEQLIIIGGCYE